MSYLIILVVEVVPGIVVEVVPGIVVEVVPGIVVEVVPGIVVEVVSGIVIEIVLVNVVVSSIIQNNYLKIIKFFYIFSLDASPDPSKAMVVPFPLSRRTL